MKTKLLALAFLFTASCISSYAGDPPTQPEPDDIEIEPDVFMVNYRHSPQNFIYDFGNVRIFKILNSNKYETIAIDKRDGSVLSHKTTNRLDNSCEMDLFLELDSMDSM